MGISEFRGVDDFILLSGFSDEKTLMLAALIYFIVWPSVVVVVMRFSFYEDYSYTTGTRIASLSC